VRLIPNTGSGHRRQFAFLAPSDSNDSAFRDVAVNPCRHCELLAQAQTLRGKIYADLGALDPSQLLEDGRHVHDADNQSWHLITLDDSGRVVACLRYLAHPSNVSFSKLTISHSALAKSEAWGPKLRIAVEGELRQARDRCCSYVEIGGWAITESLRCTTEALRMIVMAYALAQQSGGALGITNATLRSCSASILRRIGGRRLTAEGVELPSYFETEYQSVEAEILGFDSLAPNPRYKKWMKECQSNVRDVPVIRCAPRKGKLRSSFIRGAYFGVDPIPEIA
jgi:hypothetical protein